MVNFVAFHHRWYFPCSCVLVVRRIPQLEKAGQEQAEGRCPRKTATTERAAGGNEGE